MLGINQLDFMSYATALKSNYRKGIRRLEAILSNPTHAAEFAANLGGVSVVLGVPIGREDRNSEALLSLLLNSDIADDAVLTWMHQFYEFTTWDDLMGNSARVQEMMNNPLLWRALGGSKKAVGKGVATLAGLSCVSYADIDAVVASSTAMAAVAASQTAMTAIVASPTAMAAIWKSNAAVTAVKNNATAWKTFTGATSAVMGKTVAILADLNPADYADMTAVAASQTAMAAIQKSQTAKDAIAASSMATAKYAAGAAGLNPADYADMTVLAASSTAMAAVIGNATALNAVVSSSTAMTAVAASKVATGAIAASATALAKIAGSTTALDALYAKKSRLTGASASKSGKFIILQISSSSAFSTSQYGYATLSDGSQPDWGSYLGKYEYFKQFKMVATFIKNDTESDDWIDYFPCG